MDTDQIIAADHRANRRADLWSRALTIAGLIAVVWWLLW